MRNRKYAHVDTQVLVLGMTPRGPKEEKVFEIGEGLWGGTVHGIVFEGCLNQEHAFEVIEYLKEWAVMVKKEYAESQAAQKVVE